MRYLGGLQTEITGLQTLTHDYCVHHWTEHIGAILLVRFPDYYTRQDLCWPYVCDAPLVRLLACSQPPPQQHHPSHRDFNVEQTLYSFAAFASMAKSSSYFDLVRSSAVNLDWALCLCRTRCYQVEDRLSFETRLSFESMSQTRHVVPAIAASRA